MEYMVIKECNKILLVVKVLRGEGVCMSDHYLLEGKLRVGED